MSTREGEPKAASGLLIFDQQLLEDKDYWTGLLSRDFEPARLYLDHHKTGKYSGQQGIHALQVDAETYQKLVELTNKQPFLLYAALMTALKVCLYKYTKTSAVVVGSPARKRAGLSQQPVNALAIVNELSDEMTFRQVLLDVRQVLLDAYARQSYPFDHLVRDLELKRSDDAFPLFGVALTLEEIHGELPELNNDLTIKFKQDAEGLSGTISFDRGLFTPDSIARFAGQLLNVLRESLANTSAKIADLSLLTGEERQRILSEWNDTKTAYPAGESFHQLFEAQAERTPDDVAVVFKDEELTYGELNRRANQLAHYLRRLGVAPEVFVGLCFERSIEMLVAMLGILKAGGAYVPLDSQYPKERLAFILEDAEISVLLTEQQLVERLPEHQAVRVTLDTEWETIAREDEGNVESGVRPENLAYVIYTSGSTGKPKGVLITHAGVCNVIAASVAAFGLGSDSRIIQVASLSFDSSVMEILMAWSTGGRLYLVDRGTLLESSALTRLLRANAITTLVVPPPLRSLIPAEDLPALREVIVGGEVCTAETVKKWTGNGRRLFNCYAPTETTIYSTVMEVSRDQQYMPPIGRPIANMQVYILDEHLNAVPVGIAGELHVGGVGIARGYLKRPEVSAEKFIPHPFALEPGARLYKTGDMALYLPDGNIEFLGRVDDQVKIRGFRIEPGEVEAVLNQHPSVRQCLVVAREDVPGEKRLVAYVISEEERALTVNELRGYLKERLPDYMVPSAFVTMESFPQTPNGKIDRRTLPAPDASRPELEEQFVAPGTETEKLLAGIWSEILGVESIGIHDNFFDIGGRSLNATQVMSRIRKATHIELPVQSLFEKPTLSGLAAELDNALGEAATTTREPSGAPVAPIPRISRDVPLVLSFAQQRIWFLQQMIASEIYNGPVAIEMSGRLDLDALEHSLREIIKRHEVMRTSYQMVDRQPVQVIAAEVDFSVTVIDLRHFPAEERPVRAQAISEDEARRPFDLTQAPLLRATILQLDDEEYLFLLTIHHILFDRWSLGIFIKELELLYEARVAGQSCVLPELPIQYADFAYWQRQLVSGQLLEAQLDYWKKQLADLPQLELPIDFPIPEVSSYRGRLELFEVPSELAESLRTLSADENATLFMTLLAAHKVLLYRYTGQEDIVLGAPIANRNRVEIEPLIGFFVNSQVLRTDLSGNPTFRQLLKRVKQVALDASAHQDIPFEKLVDELRPKGFTSTRNPLFRAAFALQNTPMPELKLPGMEIKSLNRDTLTAKFDLITTLLDVDDVLTGVVEYSTDIFKRSTIAELVERYLAILEAVAKNPDLELIDIPLERESGDSQIKPSEFLRAVEQFDF